MNIIKYNITHKINIILAQIKNYIKSCLYAGPDLGGEGEIFPRAYNFLGRICLRFY